MKKTITLILFLIISNVAYSQHSNQFSQYMLNGLVINPSYAGSNRVLNITLLHRNQWIGFNGSPKTTSFSTHSSLRNRNINLGFSYISDKYGITQKNIINGIYAYRIYFRKSSLSFGMQAGIDLTTNHWEDIETTNTGDFVFTGQRDKLTKPIAGFGIYYKSKNFYSGVSSPSIIQIGTHTKNIYKPILLNLGYLINYSNELKFKPSILIKYIKHSPYELDININAYYKDFGLGFSYRTHDAIVFILQYSINEQFSAGYSYDQTISKLKTFNKGSHEILLKYEFGYKLNAPSPRYF